MAGRPKKNVVDYFPHQCEHGKSLFVLETKHPFKGYAVWFKTLELLGKSDNHFIDCRKKEDWQYLSAYMKLPESELQEIYNTLAELDSIHPELWENKIIWSLNFIKGIKYAYIKRNRMPLNFIEICDSLNLRLRNKYTKNGIIDAGNGISDTEIKYIKNNITDTENSITGTKNGIMDTEMGISGTEITQSKVKYIKEEKEKEKEKKITVPEIQLIPPEIKKENPKPNPEERDNKNDKPIEPIDPEMQKWIELTKGYNEDEIKRHPDYPHHRKHWTWEEVKADWEEGEKRAQELYEWDMADQKRKAEIKNLDLPNFDEWERQEKAKSKKKSKVQDDEEIL